jgi:DNA polymerase-1
MFKAKNHKRLVLLDTLAIIHRAYHALPDFTGPQGQPTGALYGLVTMLLKIIDELKPDYIAACYDLAKPTIRHEAYEGYKATRAKTDDALSVQITESRKVFEAFGVPTFEREGFEADDLIGTIAHEMAIEKGVDVIIASGDMDMLQLVDDERVRVYTLKKGINDTVLYDEKAVLERFGFGPKLIPDYKGLRGDPSDNIKGVPGVGEKTATELIIKFGSIEEIYKRLEKDEKQFEKKGIKARMVELLKKHKEDAEFSKMLAFIRTDAPIAFALPKRVWREGVVLEKVYDMFGEFGFRSLRERAKSSLQLEGDEGGEDIDESELFPIESIDLLWLISSEFTNPSPEDVLAFTKEREFSKAYAALTTELEKLGRVKEVYEKIEKPLIPVIEAMYERGVLVDPAVLKDLAERYSKELSAIEKRIHKTAGHEFNIASPAQLGVVLFDELGLKPDHQKKTAGGARSTKESELEKLKEAHPIISDILEYREIKKLLSTYIENLPPLLDAEHRLHAEFLQTGTTTGRMSSRLLPPRVLRWSHSTIHR